LGEKWTIELFKYQPEFGFGKLCCRFWSGMLLITNPDLIAHSLVEIPMLWIALAAIVWSVTRIWLTVLSAPSM